MQNFIIAASIASAITSMFVWRYRMEKRPLAVLTYFLAVLILEWIAKHFLMPNITLGYEIAATCLLITIVFSIALKTLRHFEQKTTHNNPSKNKKPTGNPVGF